MTFEVQPLLVYELLGRLADNLEEYVGELSESSLRDNFLTVSQVLDEMFDYGVPLHLEPNVLQDIVMPPGKLKSMVASVTGKSQVSEQLPSAATGATPWRRDGVRYASNEVFLDVTERLDATVDGRSSMLQRAEVFGEVVCKCALSGMPQLSLSFVHADFLEDCAFHRRARARSAAPRSAPLRTIQRTSRRRRRCVRLARWEKERVVSFVPPDGRFTLMSYRVQARRGAAVPACPRAPRARASRRRAPRRGSPTCPSTSTPPSRGRPRRRTRTWWASSR